MFQSELHFPDEKVFNEIFVSSGKTAIFKPFFSIRETKMR